MLYALNLQLEKIKRNELTFLLIVLTAIGTIICGYLSGKLIKSIAYLAAMWLCSFIVDIYAARKSATGETAVKKPKLETTLIAIFFLLAFVFLYFRYMGPVNGEDLGNKTRLLLVPLMFLFCFPLALAGTLLIMRYKPKDLGFRFNGLILAIPAIIITAVTGLVFASNDFTFQKVYSEAGGIGGLLLEGIIVAALMEEFWRYIAQTRLGALFNNKGLGWFVATVFWAIMHVPTFYAQSYNIGSAFLGALSKIPIGLMWGYITYRTKSILPSVLVHGINMWGLQNL